MENQFEKGPERIPSKEEVFELIIKQLEKPVIKKERYDEKGLYYFEVMDEAESVEYTYIRKGNHLHLNEAKSTVINVAFYENGIPTSGWNLFEFDEKTGEWKENK